MCYGEERDRPGPVDAGASAGNLLWQERHEVGAPSVSWQRVHPAMEGNPGGPFDPWQAGQATPASACVPWEKTTSRYVCGKLRAGAPERPYLPAFEGSAAWR